MEGISVCEIVFGIVGIVSMTSIVWVRFSDGDILTTLLALAVSVVALPASCVVLMLPRAACELFDTTAAVASTSSVIWSVCVIVLSFFLAKQAKKKEKW